MRRLLWTALLWPALLAVTPNAGNDPTDEHLRRTKETETMAKQDKLQIEGLLAEYRKSLNSSDAARAQSLYSKDGVFMPAGAPSAAGSEDIHKSYEFIFSQIQLNIEFDIDEIVVDGDFAFATTTSRGTTLIRASGQTLPEENRELFVFEKTDDAWKIARYMFNKTSR